MVRIVGRPSHGSSAVRFLEIDFYSGRSVTKATKRKGSFPVITNTLLTGVNKQ